MEKALSLRKAEAVADIFRDHSLWLVRNVPVLKGLIFYGDGTDRSVRRGGVQRDAGRFSFCLGYIQGS